MKELINILPSIDSVPGIGEYVDPADGLLHCMKCGEPRQMVINNSFGLAKTVHIPCSCIREQQEIQKRAEQEQERCKRIENLRSKGIPDRLYRNCTFDNDPGLVPEIHYAKRYVENFEKMEASGSGLIFWGGIGTGKTYLAACIANALIDQEIPVKMTTISRISNAMSGLFSEDRNRYLDSLNEYRLLIIDDLGVERNTEYSLEQIYSVIDSRYRTGRPMIITTNLSLDTLEHPPDLEHARIYSRIMEKCVPVKVNGADLRRQNAEHQFQETRKLLQTEKTDNDHYLA